MTTTTDSSPMETSSDPLNWSYFTTDLPGIGGKIKQSPEDFVVEEIPAYQPCGEGEHLFLWVEKRDVSAEAMLKHFADIFRIRQRDIGVAGLKDRFAVTRQFISIPAKQEDLVSNANTDSIQVLSAKRHRNKLKTGHTRGNRFQLVVREPNQEACWYRSAGICSF